LGKVWLNWASGGRETGAFKTIKLKEKKKRIPTGNHFEEEDFYPDEL
jgi:hypothetical protein